MRRGLLVAALTLALGAIAWVVLGPYRAAPEPQPDSDGVMVELGLPEGGAPSGEELELPREPAPVETTLAELDRGDGADLDASLRERVEPTPLVSGKLTDTGGSAISNAQITWTPIPAEFDELGSVVEDFVLELHQGARSSVSGADGVFAFAEEPDELGELESVVWITHHDYEPAAILIESGAQEPGTTFDRILQAGTPAFVRVVALESALQAPFIVTQSGFVEDDTDLITARKSLTEDQKLERLLFRSTTTDASGLAPIQIMPGRQRILAGTADTKSGPWDGVARGTVEIELGSPILVGGTITTSSDLEADHNIVLTFETVTGEYVNAIEQVSVELGAWGPIELPYVPGEEYRVWLDGNGVIPVLTVFHPEPGDELTLDMVADYGSVQWYFIQNEREEPLPEAEITVRWHVDRREVNQVFKTREDGYSKVTGIPDGVLNGEIRCPGFVPLKLIPTMYPNDQNLSLVYEMKAGRTLRGTCTADGLPVSEFEVHVWPKDLPSEPVRYRFVGTDGSFEIEGAPNMSTAICATAAGIGASDPLAVPDPPAATDELNLELVTGIRARVQVVDGESGAPVSNATAHVLIGGESTPATPFGVPIQGDRNGEIRVAGLTNGQGRLRIGAPGYAYSEIIVSTIPSTEVEVGIVPLTRKGTLEVRLIQSGTNYSDRKLTLGGQDTSAMYPFDSSGRIRIEGLNPGTYRAVAWLGNTTSIQRHLTLWPGQPWEFILDASGEGSVQVEVSGDEYDPASELNVIASSAKYGAKTFWKANFDSSGVATISNLPGGEFYVELKGAYSDTEVVLGRQQVFLGPGATKSIKFVIGENDRVIRVVDEEGTPIPGARVTAKLSPGATPWVYKKLTDAEGECVIRGLSQESFIIHLEHPVHGHRLGIEVNQPYSDEPVVLELNGDVSATFRVATPDGPVAGMNGFLTTRNGLYEITGANTDSDGLLTFHNLTAGQYAFKAVHPKYWLISQGVDVAPNQPAIPIIALRRCEVELVTKTAGLPRGGVEVQIHWLDRDQSLTDLIMFWHFKMESKDVVTSENGLLSLDGLAEGKYSWTIFGYGEDGPVSGTFELLPDIANRVEVEVP